MKAACPERSRRGEELTLDEVRRFGLRIAQPVNGYRFSLDALLLADFALPPAGAGIIDLGSGCGVVALILARSCAGSSVVAVEKNPVMAGVAGRNVEMNGLSGQVTVLEADILDLRERYPVSSFDLVVSNPPYRVPGSGRISPRVGRDLARHESTASLADFMASAKYLAKPGGRICFIQHPSRLADFIAHAGELKLALHRLRLVHDRATSPATMFLAELAKGSRQSVTVESPLIVRNERGEYSDEVAEMLMLDADHKKTSGG